MKLRLTAKIQNAGIGDLYDKVVKGKGREEWREAYDKVYKFRDGLAAVSLKGKYGFVDTKGREVIPPTYAGLATWGDGTYCFDSYGLCVVQLNGMEGMINREGEQVVPIKYDSVFSEWKNGKTHVMLDGVMGYAKPNGNVYFNNQLVK